MTGKAPPGTRTPGRRLWTSVVDAYELDEHELTLLREAVRTVDLLEHLDANGPLVERWGPPAADCPHWLAREPGQPRSWQQVHATRAWLIAGHRWGKKHGYPLAGVGGAAARALCARRTCRPCGSACAGCRSRTTAPDTRIALTASTTELGGVSHSSNSGTLGLRHIGDRLPNGPR